MYAEGERRGGRTVRDLVRAVRRPGALLRRNGLLPVPDVTEFHQGPLDDATSERFFDTGYQQVRWLAGAIERHTGSVLESRWALDFGCGVGRLTLPLAERCEHVFGLDVSPTVLREAERNASRRNVSNVEWVAAERLAELSGSYDLVQSLFVFQHIPVREGERTFATLVRGLRPGGVGAINVPLRPSHPVARLLRWTFTSVPFSRNPVKLVRDWWSYPYLLINSYSLNRLSRLLTEAGVTWWHVRVFKPPGTSWRSYDSVVIIFRKK
jgi:SAM-dependent methyltransferase